MEKTKSKTKKNVKTVKSKTEKKVSKPQVTKASAKVSKTEVKVKATSKKVVKEPVVEVVSETKSVKKATKKTASANVQKVKKEALKTTPKKQKKKELKEDLVSTEIVEVEIPQSLTVEDQIVLPKNTRNIFQIYFSGWKNMLSFKGRANRAEFFSFWSVAFLLLSILSVSYTSIVLSTVLVLALLTLTVRRFHDRGVSGFISGLLFLLAMVVVPVAYSFSPLLALYHPLCYFLYFILAFLPGDKHENKYGKAPLPASKIALFLVFVLSLPLLYVLLGLVSLCLYLLYGMDFSMGY